MNQAGDAALIHGDSERSPQDYGDLATSVNRPAHNTVPSAVGGLGSTFKIGGVTAALRGPEQLHDGPMPLFIAGVSVSRSCSLLVAFHCH
jgi:hypothetical protein